MQALIMAAGFGTRLEPLTKTVPKPLVLIANQPIMQLNIELLKFFGIENITANIHYFPEQIQNYFGDGSDFDVNLNYSYEEELLGTAGGVLKMARIANNLKETFLVLSSDALTNINLQQLIDFHRKKRALVTVALTAVEETEHYGIAVLNDEQKIVSFQEKPSQNTARSNLANTGIYVMEPEILKLIPSDTFYDFGKQLFPQLVEGKEKIFGWQTDGYWSDIGNLTTYQQAHQDLFNQKIKLSLSGQQIGQNVWIGKGTKIDPSTKISGGLVVGTNCHIGKNVKLKGGNTIGDFVIIEDGAEITESIIWPNTYIGSKSKLHGSILGAWCHLDSGVEIKSDSALGSRTRLRSGSKIDAGSRLLPDTIL